MAQPDARPVQAQLIARTKQGKFDRNGRRDRKMLIAGKKYERGIAMPSPGEIVVQLAAPAKSFDAIAGVDSNDLGYYDNAGRGSVVASVECGSRQVFQSGTLKEGMPGVAIHTELGGATEFRLKLAAVGNRLRTYQGEWDQLDWAEARVTMADGSVVWLADLPAGPLPAPYAVEAPFSFRYGGRPSAEFLGQWKVERESRAIDANRTRIRVTYTDAASGLQARAEAVAYADYPTVEWTVYFRNTGTQPTPILEDIQAIDTQLERTPEGEFQLHHSIGSPNSPTDFRPLETVLAPGSRKAFVARGGRPTDTDLGNFNLEWAGGGAIVTVGWPAQWSAEFVRDKATKVRVRSGQELTHLRLLPGEEIRTPLVVLQFWRGGDWIDAQNVWRRWMLDHNLPRPGGKLPPPMLSSGSSRQTVEMQEANEANQVLYLNRALDAGLKLDYWWMDAGWYPYQQGWYKTGTWEVDPARFPRGFVPISEAAHKRGTKIIVWFEPERVTDGTWLHKNHPEWLLGPDGKDKLLNLGNPDALHWVTEHVSNLIRTQGIDLYRQDFNFEPLQLWRNADTEDRQGITENKYVAGYLAYLDELHRRFPEMILDNCASGGRRDDLETLRRSVPLWRSDFAYDPEPMQQFTYGMALWIPYFGSAFNSLDPYIFRSQMTPALSIGMVAERYENGLPRMKSLLAQWQRVSEFYAADFYPLTPYTTEKSGWLAWQFNRPERGDGVIHAFRRADNAFELAKFRLRGVEAGARYKVTNLDTARSTVVTGAELTQGGLPVTLTARPGSALILYEKLAVAR
ncbi:alpha-galactosidase [Paludibaculum fermentans]|uniref:Alpha-galactosidase n=1 Tax=Paludibaculum fermentans TaxID=1473598 RepID=A0A7S7NR90_PALFE|nr:alpha-galactosidase [Paludibaculum fermentans]QOY88337.1 alpha-galactosidase [Paludibaculum fermentans]